MGIMLPQTKELSEGRREDHSRRFPSTCRGYLALPTPGLRLLASGTGRQWSSMVLATLIVLICHGSPSKLTKVAMIGGKMVVPGENLEGSWTDSKGQSQVPTTCDLIWVKIHNSNSKWINISFYFLPDQCLVETKIYLLLEFTASLFY